MYKEVNGSSFATLIRNQDFALNKSQNPFRMVYIIIYFSIMIWLYFVETFQKIGTFYTDNSSTVIDVLPEFNKTRRPVSESNYDPELNNHGVYKRAEDKFENIDSVYGIKMFFYKIFHKKLIKKCFI